MDTSRKSEVSLIKVSAKNRLNDGNQDMAEAQIYDPHRHRDVRHPTTDAETLIHLLKGSLGTGILAMPNAFRNSGLVTGTLATIVIGALCTYCIHLLVKAQYKLCQRLKVPILNYPNSMKTALEQGPHCLRKFAAPAPIFVDTFLIIYQLGICCVYIVFVASNIKQVADEYIENEIDLRYYMLILLVPLIIINYIRNLKLLAPFSSLANIITFIGLGIIMYYVFEELPPLSEREMFGTPRNFALYFGTTLFALEAVGVIIALENNMEKPAHFGGTCGVLNTGMSVIVLLYIIIGFFGYIKYGDKALGSITLNLPKDHLLAQVLKLMFALAIYFTYALQAYVPVEILWSSYMERHIKTSRIFWEYILRTCISIATFALAFFVPRLELFISLFGAFCLSALGIAFPAIIDICTSYPDEYGPCKYKLLRDIALIIFGLIGLTAGTYVSFVEIVHSFS